MFDNFIRGSTLASDAENRSDQYSSFPDDLHLCVFPYLIKDKAAKATASLSHCDRELAPSAGVANIIVFTS